MPTAPDYDKARDEAGFTWSVAANYLTYLTLSGISFRDFYLEPDACVEVYRKGRPAARELFGDDVTYAGPATPSVSYGHTNCLGCELVFPEGGEVGYVSSFADSLDRAIAAAEQPVDFAAAAMAPQYLALHEQMRAAFPGEAIKYAYGEEATITTAYIMRGEELFFDVMDEPEKSTRFLSLITESALEYYRFRCSINGTEPFSAEGATVADDIAPMVSPRDWPEFVLPYWEQTFAAKTSGARHAHMEDLRPQQLPFLEELGLASFDPAISAQLNPKVISDAIRVPFSWRLGALHIARMSVDDVTDFVFQAAADGASKVTATAEPTMCEEENVAKVMAFIDAAKEAEALLADGGTREQLGERVSAEGRERFWDGI